MTRHLARLSRRSFLAALVLSLPLVAATSEDRTEPGANWPGWRGPGGLAVSDDERIPLSWSETENLLWKTAIEGLGHSSPVVWGDRVFLTTAIEGEPIPGAEPPKHTFDGQEFKHPDAMGADRRQTMKVLALDAASGEILWSRVAYDGRVYDDRHKSSSYASPTPATDGERVYAYFGSEGVYAYDFDGGLAWSVDIGKIRSVGLGVATSPVLYENLLILQADEDSGELSFIVALDKRTGAEVWKTNRPVQASWTTPLLARDGRGRDHLVTSGNELFISYDPATGKEIWRAKGLLNNAIHAPLVTDDGIVVLSSGYPEKITVGMKLDQDGELGDETRLWEYTKGTAYVPSNLLYDGYLYLLNDGGVLTCLDPKTGAVIYEGGRFPQRGRFMASPIAVNGALLMINTDGDAAFVKAGPEHEVLAESEVGEQVFATPAVADGRLFIRGEHHLFAIGKKG